MTTKDQEVDTRVASLTPSALSATGGKDAPNPNYPLGEFDGSKWAVEFMRLFGHRKDDIDEDLMLGWFCNAIMTGFDEHARRGRPTHDALVSALQECVVAASAAMRVVADLDAMHLAGASADTRQQRFIEELHIAGVKDGFGVRANAALALAGVRP